MGSTMTLRVKSLRRRRPPRKGRPLLFEHLEERIVLSWFGSVKSTAYNFAKSVEGAVAGAFAGISNVATKIESALEQGFAGAQTLGPLPNNLTGPGATLLQANQRVLSQYKTNELAVQIRPTVPSATVQTLKNLGSALSRLGIRVGRSSRIAYDAGHQEVPHEQEVYRPIDGSGTG
jgi:hypothetical protein